MIHIPLTVRPTLPPLLRTLDVCSQTRQPDADPPVAFLRPHRWRPVALVNSLTDGGRSFPDTPICLHADRPCALASPRREPIISPLYVYFSFSLSHTAASRYCTYPTPPPTILLPSLACLLGSRCLLRTTAHDTRPSSTVPPCTSNVYIGLGPRGRKRDSTTLQEVIIRGRLGERRALFICSRSPRPVVHVVRPFDGQA